jgi:hypothetical protein
MVSTKVIRAWIENELKFQSGKEAVEGTGLNSDDADDFDVPEAWQAAVLLITNSDESVELAFARENDIDIGALKHQAAEQIKAEVAAEIAQLRPPKTPSPKSPLAQPSAAPVAHAGNPKPKTLKPKAQARLSAEDAQLGIAEAMQGIEAPPADGAGVVPSPASQFNKGQQVKVTTVSTQHAVWRQKYEGLTGTVKALNFDCALNLNIESYEVTFKGRTGGVADFAPVELEAA